MKKRTKYYTCLSVLIVFIIHTICSFFDWYIELFNTYECSYQIKEIIWMFFGFAIPVFGIPFFTAWLISIKEGNPIKTNKWIGVLMSFAIIFAIIHNYKTKESELLKMYWKNQSYYVMTAVFDSFSEYEWSLTALYDNRYLVDQTDNRWGEKYQKYSKDTVLVKQTLSGYSEIIKIRLSAEEKKKFYKPVLYVDNKEQKNYSQEVYRDAMHKSHKRLGFVFEKQKFGLLKIGITESKASYHVISMESDLYDDVYKLINIGDTVVLRVSDSIPQINRVLDWQPTPEEIEKYKTPVRLIEKN